MTANSEKILEMTKIFVSNSYKGLTGELTPERVYEYLYQKAVRSRDNLTDNNKLLNEWLYPLLKNSKALTDEQADDLYELAQALFQPAHNLDIELAAAIYEALTDYAHSTENENFLIKSLYWSALTLHYMDKMLFHKEILQRYTEAASYRCRYREIGDFETRRYVNRSLGNIFVTKASQKEFTGPYPILEAMDEARVFWEDPEIRAFDPDMPWESFIYAIHQNTCSTVLTFLRDTKNTYEGLAERVYESAVYMNDYAAKHFSKTQASHAESLLEYFLICAKYHTGRITAREAGEKFLSMVQGVEDGDYSLNAVNKITHTGLAMTFYLDLDPHYPKDELKRIRDEHCNKVVSYCAKLPNGAAQFTADSMIGAFIYSTSTDKDSDRDLLIDTILKLTTYRHIPSYVHALMVSWLGELICTYMCDNKPEFFIGVNGTASTDEVRRIRDDIVNYARVGGLCHDVGKIMYINIIASYGRKLSNREFAIVQLHPYKGFEMLKNSGYNAVAEIARGHHKWYNGKKGYPLDYDHRSSEYRSIIDIIAVCDTIDTETDILGRTNAVGLSLRDIVKQIQAMSGAKFAPEVAAALNDPVLIEGIDHILNVKRREAYCTAYGHSH